MKLFQLRSRCADVWEDRFDDYFALRWLRARNFSVDKAEYMLRQHLIYRNKIDMDNITRWYKPPEVSCNRSESDLPILGATIPTISDEYQHSQGSVERKIPRRTLYLVGVFLDRRTRTRQIITYEGVYFCNRREAPWSEFSCGIIAKPPADWPNRTLSDKFVDAPTRSQNPSLNSSDHVPEFTPSRSLQLHAIAPLGTPLRTSWAEAPLVRRSDMACRNQNFPDDVF